MADTKRKSPPARAHPPKARSVGARSQGDGIEAIKRSTQGRATLPIPLDAIVRHAQSHFGTGDVSSDQIQEVVNLLQKSAPFDILIEDNYCDERAIIDREQVLDAVAALRADFERGRDASATFASRAPRPKWPGRKGPNKTDMLASEWLEKHYAELIADGYTAADLNRDDPRLYVALTNEAQTSRPKKKLTDFIPAKNKRIEDRRHYMATILGTDVDSAAEFFASARRSVNPSRRGR